ncbi:hypothetical protein DFJ73DRAFT_759186 [Zopfochytrium polystomum]|nr:hypothetical protein DFJ73DRAFT_759186 [Zopfochytrium polystomum]
MTPAAAASTSTAATTQLLLPTTTTTTTAPHPAATTAAEAASGSPRSDPAAAAPPPAPVASATRDRDRLRRENARGSLGANVNFDGSPLTPPPPPLPHSSPRTEEQGGVGGGIFGRGEAAAAKKRSDGDPPRRGAGALRGIAAALTSDAEANWERRRAAQVELAQFERIQRAEREALRREARKSEIEADRKLVWMFGSSGAAAAAAVKAGDEEVTSAFVSKFDGSGAHAGATKGGKVRASFVVEEERVFNQTAERSTAQQIEEQKHADPTAGMKQLATVHAPSDYWRPDEDARHKRPAAARDDPATEHFYLTSSFRRISPGPHTTTQSVDPITLQPLPPRPAVVDRRRRTRPAQPQDERTDVYPLYGYGDAIPNSLPLAANRIARARAPRQATDVSEPAYFHFGRPGNGAPVLNSAAKVDPKLLDYKGDRRIETLHEAAPDIQNASAYRTYTEPRYGRKKVDNGGDGGGGGGSGGGAERERVSRRLGREVLREQEEELRTRRDAVEMRRRAEVEEGRKELNAHQFAENYPWRWGSGDADRKKNPRHKVTDIAVPSTEPVDRAKALLYKAELDRLVEDKESRRRRTEAAEGGGGGGVVGR